MENEILRLLREAVYETSESSTKLPLLKNRAEALFQQNPGIAAEGFLEAARDVRRLVHDRTALAKSVGELHATNVAMQELFDDMFADMREVLAEASSRFKAMPNARDSEQIATLKSELVAAAEQISELNRQLNAALAELASLKRDEARTYVAGQGIQVDQVSQQLKFFRDQTFREAARSMFNDMLETDGNLASERKVVTAQIQEYMSHKIFIDRYETTEAAEPLSDCGDSQMASAASLMSCQPSQPNQREQAFHEDAGTEGENRGDLSREESTLEKSIDSASSGFSKVAGVPNAERPRKADDELNGSEKKLDAFPVNEMNAEESREPSSAHAHVRAINDGVIEKLTQQICELLLSKAPFSPGKQTLDYLRIAVREGLKLRELIEHAGAEGFLFRADADGVFDNEQYQELPGSCSEGKLITAFPGYRVGNRVLCKASIFIAGD